MDATTATYHHAILHRRDNTMKFAAFYKQHLADVEMMEADECECEDSSGWDIYTDQQLIDALISGIAGVDDAGHELARRGSLYKVPGNDWGE